MNQLASPQRRERLAALGVSDELFEKAITYATSEAKRNTGYDAPSMPGITFWSRANRYLAEELTDRDKLREPWKWTSRDSILRVVHPSGSHAITAISGEGPVGDLKASKQPRSKNPKGSAVARLVEANSQYVEPNGQIALASRDGIQFGRELDDIPLWFFLYRRTKEGLVKAELSLPVRMEGMYVTHWHERIPLLLPDIDPGVNLSLDAPDEGVVQPEVPVQRRKREA